MLLAFIGMTFLVYALLTRYPIISPEQMENIYERSIFGHCSTIAQTDKMKTHLSFIERVAGAHAFSISHMMELTDIVQHFMHINSTFLSLSSCSKNNKYQFIWNLRSKHLTMCTVYGYCEHSHEMQPQNGGYHKRPFIARIAIWTAQNMRLPFWCDSSHQVRDCCTNCDRLTSLLRIKWPWYEVCKVGQLFCHDACHDIIQNMNNVKRHPMWFRLWNVTDTRDRG